MKFKPEDFMLDHENGKAAALRANELLQAHLATLPRVYGAERLKTGAVGSEYLWEWCNKMDQGLTDTHTALLWGITEIEKKECEHEPRVIVKRHIGGGEYTASTKFDANCVNCGVKLKAKWEKA